MLRKIAKKYPQARQILYFASVGSFIAGSLVFPQLPKLLKGKDLDYDNFLPQMQWEPFDKRRLRQRLKEMSKNKLIKIYFAKNKYLVQITNKGRQKLMQYDAANLTILKPKEWDKKWRIVSYDIPKEKDSSRKAIRFTLTKLGFFQLQKSVYLYPYPCEEIIDFFRELYSLKENVTLLTVGSLENSEAYEEYFDL